MTKLKERIDYQERLNRVIVFIHDHLDEEIDLNRLADVACLSPYHWHRIYHAMHGETIAATVRRLRLHRAAGFLANTAMPIETIAEKSGYAGVAAFSRAFTNDYGMPPAQYRKDGAHAKFLAQTRADDGDGFEVDDQDRAVDAACDDRSQGLLHADRPGVRAVVRPLRRTRIAWAHDAFDRRLL